jgi:hypothetical protein
MAVFYRPPADIDDFSRRPALAQRLAQNWHDYISSGIAARASENGLFYDAEHDPDPATAAAKAPIPWNGFPRSIWQWFNADADPAGAGQAFAAAEVLADIGRVRHPNGTVVTLLQRQQDEYCEWHTDRNAAGGITRIAFTAEGPEYYEKMAAVDLTLVGDLYRQHVNPAVRDEDLVWDADMRAQGQVVFRKGDYNKWNKWNTQLGAMHLTHQANTLGAEINLGADATSVFPVPAAPANTLPSRLICCAQFGGVNRSSDPLIGAGVNGFASQGLSVTLANPVGLYMMEIAVGGLRNPQGAPIGPDGLRLVRASADRSLILRAEIAPPAGASYTLDQCTFEGQPITGGGVIARRITMVLFGLAKRIPGRTALQGSCRTKCCRKPDTGGFLKLVRSNQDCAQISTAQWNEDAPVTATRELAEAPESKADEVLKVLSAGRAPILD